MQLLVVLKCRVIVVEDYIFLGGNPLGVECLVIVRHLVCVKIHLLNIQGRAIPALKGVVPTQRLDGIFRNIDLVR